MSELARARWLGGGIGALATLVLGLAATFGQRLWSTVGRPVPYELPAVGKDTVGVGPLVLMQRHCTSQSQHPADSTGRDSCESAKTWIVMATQMTLGRMGFWPGSYSGVLDSRTRSALMQYEAARALPITGNPFAPATYRRLSADAERLTRTEKRPNLGMTQFSWQSRWVLAEGPWVTAGEPDTYERAEVLCDRTTAECTFSSARLDGLGLHPIYMKFEVNHWDNAEIVTKPVQADICGRSSLRVNRVQKSAVMTTSTTTDTPLCKAVPETISHLGDSQVLDSLSAAETEAVLDSLVRLGPAARQVVLRVTGR